MRLLYGWEGNNGYLWVPMAFYGSLFVSQGSDYMTNIMGLALAVYKWVLTLWVVIGPYSNQCGTDGSLFLSVRSAG